MPAECSKFSPFGNPHKCLSHSADRHLGQYRLIVNTMSIGECSHTSNATTAAPLRRLLTAVQRNVPPLATDAPTGVQHALSVRAIAAQSANSCRTDQQPRALHRVTGRRSVPSLLLAGGMADAFCRNSAGPSMLPCRLLQCVSLLSRRLGLCPLPPRPLPLHLLPPPPPLPSLLVAVLHPGRWLPQPCPVGTLPQDTAQPGPPPASSPTPACAPAERRPALQGGRPVSCPRLRFFEGDFAA